MTETAGAWGDGGHHRPPSAVSSPWSRVITVGVNSCDGYSRCSFEGTGRDLKLHKRECPFSDAGAMYRVFRGAGYR